MIRFIWIYGYGHMVFMKLFASRVGGKGIILLKTSHVLSISENHIQN